MLTQSTPRPDKTRIALLVIGGVLWLAVFAAVYVVWQKRQQSAADVDDDANDPQRFSVSMPLRPWEVRDFELTECRGRTVRRSDLLGRPWVASFIFTRCSGACPRVVSQLKILRDRIGKSDVRLVTFTVDPEHDTPAVLKRYAAELKAEPDRWLFLTGSQKDVYELIQRGFQLAVAQRTGEDRKPGDEVVHSQFVLLVDAKGFVVGKFDGANELEMTKLVAAIRKLDSKESDPSTGERTPANGR